MDDEKSGDRARSGDAGSDDDGDGGSGRGDVCLWLRDDATNGAGTETTDRNSSKDRTIGTLDAFD